MLYTYFLICFICVDLQHMCKCYGWYKDILTEILMTSVSNW